MRLRHIYLYLYSGLSVGTKKNFSLTESKFDENIWTKQVVKLFIKIICQTIISAIVLWPYICVFGRQKCINIMMRWLMIHHHAWLCRTSQSSTASTPNPLPTVPRRRQYIMYPHMFRWLFDVRSSRSQRCRVYRKITDLIWYYILAFVHKLPGPARTTAVYDCGKLIIHTNNSKREVYRTMRAHNGLVMRAQLYMRILSSHIVNYSNKAVPQAMASAYTYHTQQSPIKPSDLFHYYPY